MELQNYYQLLNIEKSSDLNAIKKAFRIEIALYHPVNNTAEGARIRFDLLIEGFDILSNPKKRQAYDDMLFSSKSNKPIILREPIQEEYYKEWKKESKEKSKSYWESSLSELLLLDLFLDTGFDDLFSGTEDLFDDLEDTLGNIFDIF